MRHNSAFSVFAMLLLLLLLVVSVAAKKGISEEGEDTDCEGATGWEALEKPEEEEGCSSEWMQAVLDFFERCSAAEVPTRGFARTTTRCP